MGADVEVVADGSLEQGVYVTGANRDGWHMRGVEPGRDFSRALRRHPQRSRRATAARSGGTIRIEPAIEIGNIFKLGTRYSEPLGATYLDEAGKEHPIVMGSYGIGPARILAAAIEQGADEHGISWPKALAPFDVQLVAMGKPGSDERELAERLYDDLTAGRFRRPLRRPRRKAGREARGGRAARMPAAGRRREAHLWRAASSRCRFGAARRRGPCHSTPRPRRFGSCGRNWRRRFRATDGPSSCATCSG